MVRPVRVRSLKIGLTPEAKTRSIQVDLSLKSASNAHTGTGLPDEEIDLDAMSPEELEKLAPYKDFIEGLDLGDLGTSED